jgi:hypothetical protein
MRGLLLQRGGVIPGGRDLRRHFDKVDGQVVNLVRCPPVPFREPRVFD